MLVGRTKYDAPAIKRHPEITHLIELKALNSSINFNMSGRPNQETTTDHNRSGRPHQNETTYDLFEHLFSGLYLSNKQLRTTERIYGLFAFRPLLFKNNNRNNLRFV